MNQHATKELTATERNFMMSETFARANENDICQNCKAAGTPTNECPCATCGFPAPEQPRPEPGVVRGHLTLRRDGDSYTGRMTLHGFHYVIAARVAEDAQGKHFVGGVFDDMDRQVCEIALADLPVVARDPRHNATQREMLTAIHQTFQPKPKGSVG